MNREELMKKTKAFLLDLDGTLYLGDALIGDSVGTLSKLRRAGKKLVFLTNNSSRTAAMYRERLKRLGLYENDLVYTSATAAIDFLLSQRKGKKVHLLGTEALKAEFSEAGILLDEKNPDICLLAYDTELTFEKLRLFDLNLRRGAEYLATHPDEVCPCPDGSMPDVGAFAALFERSSKRRPDKIIGKPYGEMAEGLGKALGVSREEMCMVGDRMYTDIRFANQNGMKSVLVLSGETTAETVGAFPDRPDLILGSINDLIEGAVR